tara:strand:+ start:11663 stop:12568 length:906 start_codon:yes stop_codon:yes gene_type:complete
MILVTGANGFLGKKVVEHVYQESIKLVKSATRNPCPELPNNIVIGPIDSKTNWSFALQGVQTIVHCAGRAHQIDNDSLEAKKEFFDTNYHGTVRLLQEANSNGVDHFIYISSVKVMGDSCGLPFDEGSKENPRDYYGESKLAAEEFIKSYCQKNEISYTILRPCLIYGNDVKANLKLLNDAILKIPFFPTFCDRNSRSLTNVNSLVKSIYEIISEPEDFYNNVYFIADETPYSTKDICEYVRFLNGSNCYLFDFINPMLKFVLGFTKSYNSLYGKLYESLSVDIKKSKSVFKTEFKSFKHK